MQKERKRERIAAGLYKYEVNNQICITIVDAAR